MDLSESNTHEIPRPLLDFIRDKTIVVRSPGRINLIGEHTDYNNGFVLPAAIDQAAYFSMNPRSDDEINLVSIDFSQTYSTTVYELKKSEVNNWPNYILGVVEQFKNAGVQLSGCDAVIYGEVPIGAGLSSSAAVECAVVMAFNEIYKCDLQKLDLVQMAQRAENNFVGMKCGIMDQFASVFGKKNHAMLLDCRSLHYDYFPLNLIGYKIVLLDTNVKHSLAFSEYNTRRNQCEKGVALLQQNIPAVASLRDATAEMLEQWVLPRDLLIYQRCKFVIDENARVLSGCEDLSRNDLQSFGKKMFASHEGLSKDYEVSCAELDFLVDFVREKPEVVGARMMGGGFGGCTINIVKEEAIENLIDEATAAYQNKMRKTLKAYIAKIGDGTRVLKSDL